MQSSVTHTSLSGFSDLIYGVWRLADDSDTSDHHVRRKIDTALELGMSSFDHADIYGDYRCEALFGRALKQTPSLREHMELISKCDILLLSDRYPERRVKYYDTSRAHIHASVERSLAHLHTDHLDLLLLHRPDPCMDPEETGRALDDLVSSGKVKALGVSNFMPWDYDLLQAHMHHRLITNQIEISLLHRAPFTNGQLAHLQQQRLSPMAWSPLAGGNLFADGEAAKRLQPLLQGLAEQHQCSVASIAIAWLLHHPADIRPIIGTNNLTRLQEMGEAQKIALDRQTWFELWTLAAGEEVP